MNSGNASEQGGKKQMKIVKTDYSKAKFAKVVDSMVTEF